MGWLQLATDLGEADPDTIETLLTELGAIAITLQDAGDHPLLEPLPGETPIWPTVRLTALFPDDADRDTIRTALQSALPGENCEFSSVAEQDWQAGFEANLRPLQFGKRLWVLPGAGYTAPTNSIAIRLAPGLAFGTGTHPTTAMCLRWLEAQQIAGKRVLDYGCGSGVLGIAAAALGAAGVTMTDIDPQALTAAADNAAQNGLAALTDIRPAAKNVTGVQHDILLANILSNTLIELGPQLEGMLRPGASLAITGILADQVDTVIAAWSGWANLTVGDRQDDWVLLTGVKNGLKSDSSVAEN